MYDYNGRAVFASPEFLKSRQWRDAGSYADCAFMLGSRTELPMWEYRDRDDERKRVFDLGMQSEIVASLSSGKPFSEELAARGKRSVPLSTLAVGATRRSSRSESITRSWWGTLCSEIWRL